MKFELKRDIGETTLGNVGQNVNMPEIFTGAKEKANRGKASGSLEQTFVLPALRDHSFGPDKVFDFSSTLRNAALLEAGLVSKPKVTKTGTTIVAVLFKDGIVMGADKRSTQGNMIASKGVDKVHVITKSIYACGAGTAADLDQVGYWLSANLRLHELNTGKPARVVMAVTRVKQYLFQYQGHIGAYLLVGGVDTTGAHLFLCSADGYTQRHQFASDGSGSYIATSVLERGFKPNMTEAECLDLVKCALTQAMKGDNASGNAYDLMVVTKSGPRHIGPIVPEFCKRPGPIELDYTIPKGKTMVLAEKTFRYDIIKEWEETRDKEEAKKTGTETAMEVE